MSTDLIKHSIYFVLLVFLQILLCTLDFNMFGVAFCFIYVLFILMLPFQTNTLLLMGVAFLCGLIIDIFYNTPGMHAAASVAMAYARPHVLKALTPQGGYDNSPLITVNSISLSWFVVYAGILIAIHSLVLFIIETASFSLLGRALVRGFSSAILTLIVCILIQYLFFIRVRSR